MLTDSHVLEERLMLATRFTDLVGCTVPIQQAGMGAVSPPALAAAVSNAGGLGMVGTARWGAVTVAGIATLLAQTQALTTYPFGVNFLVAPPDLAAMEPDCVAVAARSARVVEFFCGWPDRRLVETVHTQGALACWQIGSQAEAVAAEAAGCDLIVAQGIEAGGHVRGTIGLLALLDEVLAAVDVPVLAAGGIGSGRAMAAALAAGADGVRIGTRFVAATESNAHPRWIEQLIAAQASDTVYTEAFSVGWENAPHRVLRSAVTAAEGFLGDIVGEVPALDGTRLPLARWQPDAISREASGEIAAMSLWAGESVGSVRRVQPAAEIIAELTAEAEHLLRRWGDAVAPTGP
jgi:NAD(P)H-dependent flavin oxidoreductase YrpB (nitropropane dioxygenase family)